MENMLLEDRPVEVVGAKTEPNLSELEAHADPISGDVVEVVEINSADSDGAQGVISGGGILYRDLIVLRLIRQGYKPNEPARLILQFAQLMQVVHAVGKGLDM